MELAVFGTEDPFRIANVVTTFCQDQLGTRATQGLVYRASAGVVLGLVLETGSRVVVKVYQPRWTASFLGAVQDVQRYSASRGFPCPLPVLEPRPIARGSDCLATIDSQRQPIGWWARAGLRR
jgi:hypothetical protein